MQKRQLSAALVVYAYDRRRFGINTEGFLSAIPKEGARDATKREEKFQQTIKDLYFSSSDKLTFEASDFEAENIVIEFFHDDDEDVLTLVPEDGTAMRNITQHQGRVA